jgi:hypothetical protein
VVLFQENFTILPASGEKKYSEILASLKFIRLVGIAVASFVN